MEKPFTCKTMARGPVGAEWSSPLLQGIVELFRIPAELALDEQVHGAGVVPVVLQDKFLPWKREEILRICMQLVEIVQDSPNQVGRSHCGTTFCKLLSLQIARIEYI